MCVVGQFWPTAQVFAEKLQSKLFICMTLFLILIDLHKLSCFLQCLFTSLIFYFFLFGKREVMTCNPRQILKYKPHFLPAIIILLKLSALAVIRRSVFHQILGNFC